jgi:hypothetical protein
MFVLLNVMINETKDTESKCSADSYATSNTYFYSAGAQNQQCVRVFTLDAAVHRARRLLGNISKREMKLSEPHRNTCRQMSLHVMLFGILSSVVSGDVIVVF